MAKISARRNPLLKGDQALNFDDTTQQDMLLLTPEQKSDRFLSSWMDYAAPFTTYRRIFNERDAKRILREIKNFHRRYVINEGWSERKYALVLEAIFEAQLTPAPLTLTRFGKMYDEASLPSQIKERRALRGR